MALVTYEININYESLNNRASKVIKYLKDKTPSNSLCKKMINWVIEKNKSELSVNINKF